MPRRRQPEDKGGFEATPRLRRGSGVQVGGRHYREPPDQGASSLSANACESRRGAASDWLAERHPRQGRERRYAVGLQAGVRQRPQRVASDERPPNLAASRNRRSSGMGNRSQLGDAAVGDAQNDRLARRPVRRFDARYSPTLGSAALNSAA